MLKDRLRHIIENKGFSQEEAADLLGITQGALNHYLTGRRKIKTDFINDFCQKMNVSIAEIYEDTPQKHDSDLNVDVIKEIYVTLEGWLSKNNYELEPMDKINLVFALYDRVIKVPKENRAIEIIDIADVIMKSRKVG
jgi:transcriptional regulator with XRE-family HTH domain